MTQRDRKLIVILSESDGETNLECNGEIKR